MTCFVKFFLPCLFSSPPPPPQPLILINYELLNKSIFQLKIQPSKNVLYMKQMIFQRNPNSLIVAWTTFQHDGVDLADSLTIAKIAGNLNSITIKQKRKKFSQIQGFILSNLQDQITCERETVEINCKHPFGQLSMMSLVENAVKTRQVEVRCLYENIEVNEKCFKIIPTDVWAKVGLMTKEEWTQFQKKLDQNIWAFAKQCPKKCGQKVIKSSETGQSRKVTCSKCNYGPYCFLCSNVWRTISGNYCGNDADPCVLVKSFADPAKRINLILSGQQVASPSIQLCPTCDRTNQFNLKSGSCKHVVCTCGVPFCWVCLNPLLEDWQCGTSYQICDKKVQVLQIQISFNGVKNYCQTSLNKNIQVFKKELINVWKFFDNQFTQFELNFQGKELANKVVLRQLSPLGKKISLTVISKSPLRAKLEKRKFVKQQAGPQTLSISMNELLIAETVIIHLLDVDRNNKQLQLQSSLSIASVKRSIFQDYQIRCVNIGLMILKVNGVILEDSEVLGDILEQYDQNILFQQEINQIRDFDLKNIVALLDSD